MSDPSLEPPWVMIPCSVPIFFGRMSTLDQKALVPEMTTLNIVPTFQVSFENLETWSKRDAEVTVSVCHDPPCLSSVVLSLGTPH